MTESAVYLIKRILGMALINGIFFFSGMLFTDLTVLQCLLYSLFNGAWMILLLLPLLNKVRDKYY